jgi:hypothetical protein
MTTPTTRIEATTEGLRHFVSNPNQYPATIQLITEDELRTLERAADILDRATHRRETSRRSLNTDWAFIQRLEDDGYEYTVTSDRPVVTSWWEIHDNVAFLANYMMEHGETAASIVEMIETPWSWTDEFEAASNQHEMELAGEQPEGFIQPTHPPRAENQRPT